MELEDSSELEESESEGSELEVDEELSSLEESESEWSEEEEEESLSAGWEERNCFREA